MKPIVFGGKTISPIDINDSTQTLPGWAQTFLANNSLSGVHFKPAIYLLNNTVVIAFPGTVWFSENTGADLEVGLTEVGLTTAIPGDYTLAANLVAAAKAAGNNVVATGFSLGGGMAAYAAAENDVVGITFDPAPVPARTPVNANGNSNIVNFIYTSGAVDFGWTTGQRVVFGAQTVVAALRSITGVYEYNHGVQPFIDIDNKLSN
jgi:hypothetical protein